MQPGDSNWVTPPNTDPDGSHQTRRLSSGSQDSPQYSQRLYAWFQILPDGSNASACSLRRRDTSEQCYPNGFHLAKYSRRSQAMPHVCSQTSCTRLLGRTDIRRHRRREREIDAQAALCRGGSSEKASRLQ